jgi:two-component system, NtrC family, nitrogen regulation sensor histidine kinase NtrY
VNRLRAKLLLLVLVAILVPLGLTLWIMNALLTASLEQASVRQLDELSKSLERTGRELYQRSRDALREDAANGKLTPRRYPLVSRADWPEPVKSFWESDEPSRFLLAGENGEGLEYLVRGPAEVRVYSRALGGVGMSRLSEQYARARQAVERARLYDFRRGFTWALLLLTAAVWLVSMSLTALLGWRVSRPIREREAWAERLAGSQAIARKMAHELKNSLTPIRLTMEEVIARKREAPGEFLEQAASIVVDEVAALERRVRAFTEFSAEPPVNPRDVDLNSLVEERVTLLKSAHPEVHYEVRLDAERPAAYADEDLLKGILTNLLTNAAEAAGAGGTVLARTIRTGVEVHDSGPGLSEEAARSVFEPTVSFKKGGMGLGLSITRRSVLLSGGDIVLVKGELGGAAFRVLLPAAHGVEKSSDR